MDGEGQAHHFLLFVDDNHMPAIGERLVVGSVTMADRRRTLFDTGRMDECLQAGRDYDDDGECLVCSAGQTQRYSSTRANAVLEC